MKANILSLFLFLGLLTSVTASPFYHSTDIPLDDNVVLIDFSVYPNPTNGVFYLNIEDSGTTPYNVKVVDLLGKTVFERQVAPNQEARFDLSTVHKGIYFVEITRSQDRVIQRVVIQ